MPRHRKPTNVLELSGAFKNHPERAPARANEPVPDGPIGEPPVHLTDYQKACWNEIVATAHAGTFGSNDALAVEHGAMILARLREARWEVDVPYMVRWEKFLMEFGMTPASRSKVSVKKPKDNGNPFAKFAAN